MLLISILPMVTLSNFSLIIMSSTSAV